MIAIELLEFVQNDYVFLVFILLNKQINFQ